MEIEHGSYALLKASNDVKKKLKEPKPNCKWRDKFSFCHSLHQMGDDCEGKCSAFEVGSKRYKSK